MNNDYEIFDLFPTTVFKKNLNIDSNDVYNMIKNTQFERQDEVNCWISTDVDILDQYPNTKKSIDDNFNFYIENILKIDTTNVNFFVCRSWIVKHSLGDFGKEHYHSNSLFSGVLYLDVDDDSGNIVFHKQKEPTKIFIFDMKEWNKFNCSTWSITPKVGDLLIFPSDLFHSITPSLSSRLRYVLAFNYFFRGTLGSGEKKLTI